MSVLAELALSGAGAIAEAPVAPPWVKVIKGTKVEMADRQVRQLGVTCSQRSAAYDYRVRKYNPSLLTLVRLSLY